MSGNDDQAEGLRNGSAGRPAEQRPGRLRCISVASGKGGVGKTFVSVGLSHCLARMKQRVLVFDADLGLANADIQMGIDPKYTAQDVIFGRTTLDEAVVRGGDGSPDLLPSASGAVEMVEMGGARRQMFVEDLVRFAANYDVLIIDVAAGIGSSITSFLKASPEVLVVVANEPTSIMDAYSLIKIMTRGPTPPSIQLVVNMVRSVDEGERLAVRLNGITRRFLGVEFPTAGIVVHDHTVGDAIRARTPIIRFAPRSAAAQCMEDVARTVAAGRGRAPAGAIEGFFEQLAGAGLGARANDTGGET